MDKDAGAGPASFLAAREADDGVRVLSPETAFGEIPRVSGPI